MTLKLLVFAQIMVLSALNFLIADLIRKIVPKIIGCLKFCPEKE